MLGAMKPYRRKLSSEDADTGSILIEKRVWRAFPPPMTEFPVHVAGTRFATRIVAEDCACVPPPHEHYHLEAGHFRHLLDFKRGAPIEIVPEGSGFIVRNG
jgi:hypothetical protein